MTDHDERRAAADRFAAALADQPLDVALAEILASVVVTAFDPLEPLMHALVAARSPESMGLLAAVTSVADPHGAMAASNAIESIASTGVSALPWASVAGSALPDEARLADYRNGAALAVRWRHGDGTTHVMFNVVEDGQVVEVRFTEGDVFEVIEQSPHLTHVTLTDVDLDAVGAYLDDALTLPIRGDDRTWHNAPLARVRYAALGITQPARFVEPPARGPDDYSLSAIAIDLMQDNRRTPWSGPLW